MIVAISSSTCSFGSSPVISQSIQTRFFLLRFEAMEPGILLVGRGELQGQAVGELAVERASGGLVEELCRTRAVAADRRAHRAREPSVRCEIDLVERLRKLVVATLERVENRPEHAIVLLQRAAQRGE